MIGKMLRRRKKDEPEVTHPSELFEIVPGRYGFSVRLSPKANGVVPRLKPPPPPPGGRRNARPADSVGPEPR